MRGDQTAILTHPAQIKVVANGRRWGKTYMSGVYSLTCADFGAAVAWVVPTYKNSRPVWRFAESQVTQVSGVSVHKSDRIITFPSGGWLGVYSADNDVGLRGESFDVVIIDEAAQVSEETYSDVILPTLADRNGRLLMISTPKGRNWFWREWMRGQSDNKQIAAFTAPTSANPSPNIRKAFEMARDRVSERTFKQEWLAEFVDDGGGVFRNVRPCAIAERVNEPLPNHTYVAGLDWALSNDYTVLSIIDATDKALVYIDRFNGIDYSLQRERIRATCERFNVRVVVAEENAMGKPNNDMLRRMGVKVRDFTTTATTKADIIEELAASFERGAIKIINDPILIGELEAYESERGPSGGVKYNAPQGMHDDMVMSLALAWSNVRQRFAYG